MKNNINEDTDYEIINMSVELPEFDYLIGSEYVEYGKNNSVYSYILDCYKKSPTNSAIINGLSNYTIGDGLVDANGYDIYNHISKQDLEKIILEYSLYGAFAVQVLWNKNREVAKVAYLSVAKIFLDVDDFGETKGYFYSFDPSLKHKYPLRWYPKFDGIYKTFDDEEVNGDIEILVVRRSSTQDFFSDCGYESGLIWAQIESELATTAYSYSLQNFSAGMIINFNNGIPPTLEAQQTIKKKIIDGLTGSENAGKVIVSFNSDSSKQTEIQRIDLPEIQETYKVMTEDCETKLFIAHNVPPILYSGTKTGSGLGNNKEELESATLSLFTRTITPRRNTIIDGLMTIFKSINKDIDLKFNDIDWIEQIKNKHKKDGEGDNLPT